MKSGTSAGTTGGLFFGFSIAYQPPNMPLGLANMEISADLTDVSLDREPRSFPSPQGFGLCGFAIQKDVSFSRLFPASFCTRFHGALLQSEGSGNLIPSPQCSG